MTAEFSPDAYWVELKHRMEEAGPRDVARHILEFEPEERRQLFSFALKAFTQREWQGKGFDPIIDVIQAGIDDLMAQAAQAPDSDRAWKVTEQANILAFNLSAELCDCWPGDDAPRLPHHHEAGLRLAEDCVRWRRELGKPPERRALAYWAVGMHHLSLGQPQEALGAWVAARELAAADRKAAGLPHRVEPGGDFAVILYHGYAGIGRMASGDPAGRAEYEAACRAFQETVARDPDAGEDAQFGLDQLKLVERKYAGGGKERVGSTSDKGP